MGEIIFQTPEKMTSVNVDLFIQMASPIFEYQDQLLPNVRFDTSTTKKLDSIGALLIYKFFEFTVHKNCFASPKSTIKGYVKDELERRLIKSLVDTFINYEKPQYNKLKFISTDNLFISPILLKKDSQIDEIAKAGKDICNYYKEDENVRFLILTCMGEIALNFKAHAEVDTESILSVAGTNIDFEIACVDTGVGIVSSLSASFQKRGISCPKSRVLERALERGISSKDTHTGHMGYGLWLLKELVLASKGEMRIYSEGYCVICHRGRIKFKQSNYWKGTIAFIKLPVTKSFVLKNKLEELRPQRNMIRIRKT